MKFNEGVCWDLIFLTSFLPAANLKNLLNNNSIKNAYSLTKSS
uniref:Uncharacterized protein n=1 Tax=Ascaris lumbricoides TaxID=6252 RepID=A0A0M3HGP6_ASCLU